MFDRDEGQEGQSDRDEGQEGQCLTVMKDSLTVMKDRKDSV